MREVPDATGDLQVFWDDWLYQIVFYICLIWVFGLNVKNHPNWKAIIIVAEYGEYRSYAGTTRRLTSRLSALMVHFHSTVRGDDI
jgi:hypothetical protein